MLNAFSVDVEYWWCNEFLTKYLPEEREDQIVESLGPLLNLLDKYNTRATFFILGVVAEEHPEVVEEIYERGHEIASHAYSHKTLYELRRKKFEEEIRQSVRLLHSITHERPKGFRAPSFSFNNSTKWAFEILEEYGFKYDSSIVPIKTPLYGVSNAPLSVYRPSKEDVAQNDPSGKIIEFPLTTVKIGGVNVPIAGGFYLRVLPLWFLKWGLNKVNKDRPAVVYIHPWEIYPKTPRLQVPFKSKFIAYYGINSALKKVEALLKEFEFKPIEEVLDEIRSTHSFEIFV